MKSEFEEIAHSGGQVSFRIASDADGRQMYQAGYQLSRPVPHVLAGVYALPQGVVVSTLNLGGIGPSMGEPPIPGCYPVLIASDSHGKFGHSCPRCKGYWRSGPWANICPYCGLRGPSHEFLSEAQYRYVEHYCNTLANALNSKESGEFTIDMDIVADAVGKEDKPEFYISEKSQQNKFTCAACDTFNDILGRFGYCSSCGTRNDLAEFESKTIPELYQQLNADQKPEDCLRDAVSSLDSFISQYAKQLAQLVPLTARRKNQLTTKRFHDLNKVNEIFESWFDIPVYAGVDEDQRNFVTLMLLRRHLYEHNGGEVDQKYIDKSGDTSVVLKQHIHETKENVQRLLSALLKIARNIHQGFHQLFEPLPDPIKAFEEKKKRISSHAKE